MPDPYASALIEHEARDVQDDEAAYRYAVLYSQHYGELRAHGETVEDAQWLADIYAEQHANDPRMD